MPTPQPLRSALHFFYSTLWSVARWTLVVWGVLNGFGIGLIGQVKQRISRRVARVSGSAAL